jgi:hypothetical protein
MVMAVNRMREGASAVAIFNGCSRQSGKGGCGGVGSAAYSG